MTLCTNCVGGIDKNRQICSVCLGTPEMLDVPVVEAKSEGFVKETLKKVVKKKK